MTEYFKNFYQFLEQASLEELTEKLENYKIVIEKKNKDTQIQNTNQK